MGTINNVRHKNNNMVRENRELIQVIRERRLALTFRIFSKIVKIT